MSQQLLPGDIPWRKRLAQIIRVNHAGEYGAKRIYAGQLSVLKDPETVELVEHMQAQEEEHLAVFTDQMTARKVRPTLLMPVWHVAGYALGAATALMGKEAAMACTVAVEEVIDEHYAGQLEELEAQDEDEQALIDQIKKAREEELEHRDTGLAHDAEQAPGYMLLSAAVKAGSKAAIWLSTRL